MINVLKPTFHKEFIIYKRFSKSTYPMLIYEYHLGQKKPQRSLSTTCESLYIAKKMARKIWYILLTLLTLFHLYSLTQNTVYII